MVTHAKSRAVLAAAAIFLAGAAHAQVERDFTDPLEDAALDAEDAGTQERTACPQSPPVTFGDLIRSGLAAGVSPRVTISIFGHPGPCPFCGVGRQDAEAYNGASAP